MANSNGEPKDDKPPKDRPEPRPPSPKATLGETVIACQSAQEVLGELAFAYVPAGALLQVLDRIPELQAAVDEALNALDADMPLVAATTLLGATSR